MKMEIKSGEGVEIKLKKMKVVTMRVMERVIIHRGGRLRRARR